MKRLVSERSVLVTVAEHDTDRMNAPSSIAGIGAPIGLMNDTAVRAAVTSKIGLHSYNDLELCD